MSRLGTSIIKYFRRMHISARLISSFFFISIFPMLIISFYLYHTYSKSVTDKLSQSTIASLQQISKTIDATLENYQYLGGKLSIDPLVQSSLSSDKKLTSKELELISLHMNNLISEKIVYPPFMKTIKILDNSASFIYDMGYDNVSFSAYQGILEQTDKQKPNDSWFYVNTFMGQNIIILGHRINSVQDMNVTLGYTLLFISEQIFTNDILSSVDINDESTIVILNTDGSVLTSSSREVQRNERFHENEILDKIYSQNNANIKDNYFTYQTDDSSYLVTYTQNKTLDSYIISCIPFTYIRGEAYKIVPAVAIFILLILGICVMLSMLLYYTIMWPIRNAVSVCNEIRMENLSSRIEIDADDELAFLSVNINQMLDKNEQLLALSKEDEERKRILEMQMLQYQINPHFLFNTLSTLKWIAELNQVPVMEEMITSLSEILKSTLMNQDEYISLLEEIRILNYYIQIQTVRYINKFNVQYEISPELDDFKIPRFILQPLVENSIYHGTYNNGRMILIAISAYSRDSHIYIHITDNGRGFDMDSPLDEGKRGKTSIGVQNVRERIARIYKGTASFQIESTPDKGTACTMILPDCTPQ